VSQPISCTGLNSCASGASKKFKKGCDTSGPSTFSPKNEKMIEDLLILSYYKDMRLNRELTEMFCSQKQRRQR
jgi:hypothetical protein